jgi:hypothetical protein
VQVNSHLRQGRCRHGWQDDTKDRQ